MIRRLAGDGIFIGHDERYAQADEFLTIWRQILKRGTISRANIFRPKARSVLSCGTETPHPPLWLAARPMPASSRGQACAGLSELGRALDLPCRKIDRVRRSAANKGRSIGFGLRIRLIVRETEAEPAAADRLTPRHRRNRRLSPEGVPRGIAIGRPSACGAARRDRGKLSSPSLWAAGPGTRQARRWWAIRRMSRHGSEYQQLIETVTPAYPHLEELSTSPNCYSPNSA